MLKILNLVESSMTFLRQGAKIGEGTTCKTTFLRLATSLTHWILLAATRQQGH